jgi:hypothetical protein
MPDPRDDERLAWVFNEPDPAQVVASMKESARRAFATTSSPPGYGLLRGTQREPKADERS